MSAQDFVRDYKAGVAKLTAAYGYNPALDRMFSAWNTTERTRFG